MTLLAIDTSSAHASVAVYDGRTILAEETWHAHRRHDDELFPAIDRVLHLSGTELSSVRLVAVAIGPGSFTGLRVGIAAAQGIARGSGARAVGVETLDAIAHPFSAGRLRVCALIPAGRGEHYSAMYRRRQGAFTRTTKVLVGSVADLARTVSMESLFTGEIDDATVSELRERLGDRAAIAPSSVMIRRAGHLAELAWERAGAGGAVDAAALKPLYIRPPAIRGPDGALLAEAELDPVASAVRSGR